MGVGDGMRECGLSHSHMCEYKFSKQLVVGESASGLFFTLCRQPLVWPEGGRIEDR